MQDFFSSKTGFFLRETVPKDRIVMYLCGGKRYYMPMVPCIFTWSVRALAGRVLHLSLKEEISSGQPHINIMPCVLRGKAHCNRTIAKPMTTRLEFQTFEGKNMIVQV